MNIHIRPEMAADKTAIYAVVAEAFGQPDEAELVEKLRKGGRAVRSLIAETNREIVGHILFTKAEIVGETKRHPAIALAPMAVKPGYQKSGIGGQLIKQGLQDLQKSGYERVIVLGHADYYPRFGFTPADQYGIRCPLDVPSEVFMACALTPTGLENCHGVMRWAPEFGI